MNDRLLIKRTGRGGENDESAGIEKNGCED
jgi:hypothetical protein